MNYINKITKEEVKVLNWSGKNVAEAFEFLYNTYNVKDVSFNQFKAYLKSNGLVISMPNSFSYINEGVWLVKDPTRLEKDEVHVMTEPEFKYYYEPVGEVFKWTDDLVADCSRFISGIKDNAEVWSVELEAEHTYIKEFKKRLKTLREGEGVNEQQIELVLTGVELQPEV